jgi:secreted trypsin-like serine protease
MGFIGRKQEGSCTALGGIMILKPIFNSLLAVSFVGFFVSCAPTTSDQHVQQASGNQAQILGGTDSTEEYQKQNGIVGIFMILKDEKGEQGGAICTGSLIRKNVVITAAHCLKAEKGMTLVGAFTFFGTDLETIMKEANNKDHSHIRAIKSILVHESYKTSEDVNNDIGLISLRENAPDGFQPIELAPAAVAESLKPGTKLTLSGFGVSKYTVTGEGELGSIDSAGSGRLRQVDGIQLVETDSSGKEMALDQSKRAGACHGDSGGPAYYTDSATKKRYLVGVTSRGEEPCTKMVVYTRTLGYTDWIDAGLKKMLQ